MSPYNPDFDIDLAWGEAQELRVLGVLSDVQKGGEYAEVKSDAYLNERFFLEVQDRRRGRADFRDTGFRTSKAPLFVLNKPGLNCLHVYRTSDLRELDQRGLLGRLRDGGTRGDCPTRGYVVTPTMLDAALAMLARLSGDPLFDQEESS